MYTHKNSGKKILIADDNPAIVDALQFMFENEGYDVETTLEGENVKELVEKQPDLLLLDVWMAGSDGRQICKIIKADAETKDIPVIMFSANAEVEKSSIHAGANDFVEKPFDMKDLIEKVEYHVGHY